MVNPKSKKEKVKIDLTLNTVDKLIKVFIGKNQYRTINLKDGIKTLLLLIDINDFDHEINIRLKLLISILSLYYKRNIKSNESLIQELLITSNDYSNVINSIIMSTELSDDDVVYMSDFITLRLRYIHVMSNLPKLQSTLTKFSTNDYISFFDVITELETSLEKMSEEFNSIKSKVNDDRNVILISESTIDRVVTNYQLSDCRILKSGRKKLNQLLKGGWRDGRLYIYLALPGSYKSATMFNDLCNIIQFNDDILPRDPTKRKCVIYFTLENTPDETFERMYSYVINRDIEIDMIDNKEFVADQFKLFMKDHNTDLFIIYIRPEEATVPRIEAEIDKIINKGYEPLAVAVDYLMKIESSSIYEEKSYQSLGRIAMQLKSMGIKKRVAVLTASQLNRDANVVADECIEKNVFDIAKRFNAGHISESRNILNEADVTFILHLEELPDGSEWLGYKRIKTRIKKEDIGENKKHRRDYFAYPLRHPMRIETDIDCNEYKEVYSLTEIAERLASANVTGNEIEIINDGNNETKVQTKKSKKAKTVITADDNDKLDKILNSKGDENVRTMDA